ncbi:uncharacterized protein LOC127256192 isoform X2 [Andrographis paniculata]|uniref:uncharacterized protein LOC127256192 isoform X2 n=1 Tax=Andrographis paniculata TaxID=175694 RepID=UPI0021E86B96|nr:uncharacterized protein LOC127256192 isoform X2 [Andrographis paniculata]
MVGGGHVSLEGLEDQELQEDCKAEKDYNKERLNSALLQDQSYDCDAIILQMEKVLSRFQIQDISHCSFAEINSTYWTPMLDSFKRIVLILFDEAKRERNLVRSEVIKVTTQCLNTLRLFFGLYQSTDLLLEIEKLLKLVLQVVEHFQVAASHSSSSYLSKNPTVPVGVWELLTVAFGLIGEIYLKVGSSLSLKMWQSTIKVLREVMDTCASRSSLLEDNSIAMFYAEFLHCLHCVLAEPRGYLAEHVTAFVASLKKFFRYGLVNDSRIKIQAINMNEVVPMSQKPTFESSEKLRRGPYRPPHLRRKMVGSEHQEDEKGMGSPKQEFLTSDSECSDNDGSLSDNCAAPFAETRLAAILCIQDLCKADPKLFTSQWTMLLPSTDVLQHKKYETTLMSCLLYDPYLKVRIAAGSAIVVMLDGPASVSLQVAEFRDNHKCGSFTTFSSSLGNILMQLHSGTLYLIKRETNRRLLALTFKILVLLMSSTPYSRMSSELLSMVISSIHARIENGFSFQSDRNNLLAPAINCLTVALSVSPPSTRVNKMLLDELSTGSIQSHPQAGVLYTLFQCSEHLHSPSISLEAFQALKELAHNYPNVIALCWKQVSSLVYGVFSSFPDTHVKFWRGKPEQSVTQIQERVMTAAIKVLDECLRAISGFKGTEDLSNNEFLDSPFTADHVKMKTISSAPSFESLSSTDCESKKCRLESEPWFEATVKHMPIIIKHSSAMVRAAAMTCFAGMTSSVFFSLPEDKQDFIISSLSDAALNDEVSQVRSAACRAIGVIACFPQIYRSIEVMENFIHAIKHNAFDSVVSVRITASWALANVCSSIGHYMEALNAGSSIGKSPQFISSLFDCALRLARDNDKVKANAVRALGNLSRVIQFTKQPLHHGDPVDFQQTQNGATVFKNDVRQSSDSLLMTSPTSFYWLEQMVQAFLSCVTTGNVKVQWNVCHALSNLFINKTLKLHDMDWAPSLFSILLLLLRDSANFKIRIQAAAALAVLETIDDYGKSYYDIVKTVVHVTENFKSDRISEPSNFKYLMALEKQLTSTVLHLLGLASQCDHRDTHNFLIKKAQFLEAWIEDVCSSIGETSYEGKDVASVSTRQKRDIILKTVRSLILVFQSNDHRALAQRFHRLQSLAGNL